MIAWVSPRERMQSMTGKMLEDLSRYVKGDAAPEEIGVKLKAEEAGLSAVAKDLESVQRDLAAARIAGGDALSKARARKVELETRREDHAARIAALKVGLETAELAVLQREAKQRAAAAEAARDRSAERLKLYNNKLAPEIAAIMREAESVREQVRLANIGLKEAGLSGDIAGPYERAGANTHFTGRAVLLPSLAGAPHHGIKGLPFSYTGDVAA